MSCLTRNTNVRAEEGTASPKKQGAQKAELAGQKNNSLFNQVLKRRRSRQSTYAPGVIDFDYAGNSSQFQHLIEKRNDLGYPNKSQLDFELKLRSYKNVTDYQAQKPWCFPAVKEFSPKKQWSQKKMDNSLLNAEFKRRFMDKYEQKNANELQHIFDKRGIIQTTMWECGLRDLKNPPRASKSQQKEPTNKKRAH
mmetsp:Transcript_9681/g.16285  ORF Transcript_9681/g.16285 Transcript_9681/m.16285 type:complete len:195 (-) Transcript_9681:46-630(-)